ncbi:unnamed protein product [Didymodactylos carnosus]|uniref:Uncharacterized protein n=1 Tax=Didymodactylos carnosus TaxID=1234261 RepID=A0A8S2G583_9BILA|nr:unnamed protein product [Didymodactylos carnosus]CAF4445479.1 unnamed protein product [Didymodactylos carnosus]
MGENDRAEKYYRLLLEQLPSDHDDIAELYNNIGDVYQNIYVTAVENYYSKPLDLELKSEPDSHLFVTHTYTVIIKLYLPSDHPHMTLIYNDSGMIYKHKSDYRAALENYG